MIVTRSRPEPVVKPVEKPGNKKKEEKAEFVVQDHFAFMSSPGKYQVPPLSLLQDPPPDEGIQTDKARDEIIASSAILEKKLLDFGIEGRVVQDRKSTRLNSSHKPNSYAVFCLKKKNIN